MLKALYALKRLLLIKIFGPLMIAYNVLTTTEWRIARLGCYCTLIDEPIHDSYIGLEAGLRDFS